MRKFWIVTFVLLFILWAVFILFGRNFGLDVRWMDAIQSGLWIGSLASFIGAITENVRTDGDLIAGAEDEDGLVFALSTPVEDLVKKDTVSFRVVKEKRRRA